MAHDEHNQIPARLAAGLGRLHEPPAMDLDGLDDTVLGEAGRRIGRPPRPLLLRPAPWLAAAAALALAATAWVLVGRSRPAPAPATTVALAPEDIDANGRVDILDAFVIARVLASGDEPDPAWDVNADGVVDDADVDLVAMTGVRLDGRSGA
jgi:hypothetical protein